MQEKIPLISLSGLWDEDQAVQEKRKIQIAQSIDSAFKEIGFFVIEDHNIPDQLFDLVHSTAIKFFKLKEEQKEEVAMTKMKKVWRGWFPLGGELTGGKQDGKQGIYFGAQGEVDDPRPLHGQNLFPNSSLPEMEGIVKNYIKKTTQLAHTIMRCIAIALKLPEKYFEENITQDPTPLFGILRYPPDKRFQFGISQHTDYGLLILLAIDDVGGLQIKSPKGNWIDAPRPQPGKYKMIINLGDMLQRLTNGRYKSTIHRVKNNYERQRISFPLFFDPSFGVKIQRLPLPQFQGVQNPKYENQYGDYFLNKGQQCFAELLKDKK